MVLKGNRFQSQSLFKKILIGVELVREFVSTGVVGGSEMYSLGIQLMTLCNSSCGILITPYEHQISLTRQFHSLGSCKYVPHVHIVLQSQNSP